MKYFLAVLLAMFLTVSGHASAVSWHGEYDRALEQAIKENKPIMVLLIKPDDPINRKLLATAFRDQPYIETINRHFVSVLITEGTKSSYPIELLYTLTYPALFFLTPHELFLSDPIFHPINTRRLEHYFKDLTDSTEK